jgi:hypothetical protein
MPRFEVEVEVQGFYTLLIEADDELQAEEIAKRDFTTDHPNVNIHVDAYDIDD